MPNFRYGASTEEMIHDNFQDAVTDLITGDAGDDPYYEWVVNPVTIHKAEVVNRKPSDYVNNYMVANIIDVLQEMAYDDVGEASEDFATDIDRVSLKRHLSEWVDRNVECKHIYLKNYEEVPYVITKEDVELALS